MFVLGALGISEPRFLAVVFALVFSITVYEAAFEVARTLGQPRFVAASMILRAAFMVIFGSVVLWYGYGAFGLGLAVALAHVLASGPCLGTFFRLRPQRSVRDAALRILIYGWPLLLSFGISAVGQSIDRLILAHYAGPAALGPYGVVADVLRQSFTVCGDAIALSLVTLAKRHAKQDEEAAANLVLQKAFNVCLAAAAFGAAFFMVFGDFALNLILNQEFVASAHDLIPIFAISFAFITMRNFYFAQVIYFTEASYLELIVSILFLVISTILSLLLVPMYGAKGAAIALMSASIVSCFAFRIIGRRWYNLPIDRAGLGIMPAMAVLFVFAARALNDVIPGGTIALAINATVFALLGGFIIVRFGFFRALPGHTVAKNQDRAVAS